MAFVEIESRLNSEPLRSQLQLSQAAAIERIAELHNTLLVFSALEPSLLATSEAIFARLARKLLPRLLLERLAMADEEELALPVRQVLDELLGSDFDKTSILEVDAFTLLARCSLTLAHRLDANLWQFLVRVCFALSVVQAVLAEVSAVVSPPPPPSPSQDASELNISLSVSLEPPQQTAPLSPPLIPEEADLSALVSLVLQRLCLSSPTTQQVATASVLMRCRLFLRRTTIWQQVISAQLCGSRGARSSSSSSSLSSSSSSLSSSLSSPSLPFMLSPCSEELFDLLHVLGIPSSLHVLSDSTMSDIVLHWLAGANTAAAASVTTSPLPAFLAMPRAIAPFSFVPLPRLYQKLYHQIAKQHCVTCNAQAVDPVVCLLCGQFYCAATQHHLGARTQSVRDPLSLAVRRPPSSLATHRMLVCRPYGTIASTRCNAAAAWVSSWCCGCARWSSCATIASRPTARSSSTTTERTTTAWHAARPCISARADCKSCVRCSSPTASITTRVSSTAQASPNGRRRRTCRPHSSSRVRV